MNDLTPEPNWKNYNLIFKQRIDQNNIKLIEEPSTFKTNDITLKGIEERWSETYFGKKSVNQKVWNGEVYRLNSYELKDEQLFLHVAKTYYKDIQGTNATNWNIGEIFGFDYLANGLIVTTTLYDKSGNIILGKRDSGVKEEFQKYSNIGGTLDYGVDPFSMIKIELNEEYGLEEHDISELYIQSMYYDYKHNPYISFSIRLNLAFKDVNEIFTKNADYEHSKIDKFEIKELDRMIQSNPERFNNSTMVALDIAKLQSI